MKLRITLTILDDRGYTLASNGGEVPVVLHVPNGRDYAACAIYTILDAASDALWNIVKKLIPEYLHSVKYGD